MRPRARAGLAISAVGLAMIAGWATADQELDRAPDGPPSPPSPAAPAPAPGPAPVRSLPAPRRAPPAIAPAVEPPAAAASAPPEGPGRDPAEAVAAERAAIDEIASRLDEALAREEVDPGWARQTESSVTRALDDARFAALELTSVECRATMCRVEVRPTVGRGATERLVDDLTRLEPFRHGGFIDFSAPGERVALFIAREGKELPARPHAD